MFDTLQDRLASVFKGLRSKGRLTEADLDATMREIRIALLEADVNLAVVKEFVAAVKERSLGAELSKALNPSQQIIKIVNEELVSILGGEARTIRFAKQPPTVIMLAGLQGAGKTTLAGKLAEWLKAERHSPLLVAADLQRPNAVLLAQPVQTMTGRGAGLSDAGLARKVDTIRRGIACNAPDPDDVLDVLSKLGGFDIAGLCGMFLGGALAGVPVLMDGFISGVAALCAVRLCPAAAKAVFASHCSTEPAARLVLDALGKTPLLTAGLHLGEGTGAVASIPLWDMALAVYNGCYSFAEGGIAPYMPQC